MLFAWVSPYWFSLCLALVFACLRVFLSEDSTSLNLWFFALKIDSPLAHFLPCLSWLFVVVFPRPGAMGEFASMKSVKRNAEGPARLR